MDWLTQNIIEATRFYGHIHEQKEPELLSEHLERCMAYFAVITTEKALDNVWENFKRALGDDVHFYKLLKDTIYFHDIGKINRNFQIKKMNNEQLGRKCKEYSDHSLLSALVYMDEYYKWQREEGIRGEALGRINMLVVLNAYVISRHHSPLSELACFEEELDKLFNRLEEDEGILEALKTPLTVTKQIIGKMFKMAAQYMTRHFESWQVTIPYIYTRFVYAVLVACDFYATSEYMQGEKIEDLGVFKNKALWEHTYHSTPLYAAIKKYQEENKKEFTTINDLRSEMFWEATKALEENNKENIYYLEAPTGSGKTNTSIQLALTLLNSSETLNKLFYIFPFNTLAEQTEKSLKQTFGQEKSLQNQIAVINSITPIKERTKEVKGKGHEEEEKESYEQMLLVRQFLHDPLVLTSHVQLFNLLFETSREQIGGMYQLANSVIILDEVQSYKNTLWTEIIGFLSVYAKLLNLKVIIMSATLPKLGELVEAEQMTELIRDREKYFKHDLFRNRVNVDYRLLEEEDVRKRMTDIINEEVRQGTGKILVEFIKKKTAIAYYNELIQLQENGEIDIPIRLVTGDDSKWEREACIQEVKASERILLVATQLIEAGVDIDMDLGFKDISLLDAEEQFLGRINRSCLKKGCKVYFFNLDEAATIYKNDYRKRKQFTLLEKENQRILRDKDFANYYKGIMEMVKAHGEKENVNNVADFLKEQVLPLKSKEIAEHMRLIADDLYPVSVFLARDIEIIKEGKTIYLKGSEIWEEYASLIRDKGMPYAERKVKLSQLQEILGCFIWKVKSCQVSYNERIGDLYYIEDGEQYFVNGKFNREQLSGSNYELI